MTSPKNTSISRNARPMLFGFALGFAAALGTVGIAQVRATVNTNGVLFGYTVQKNGATICTDPSVWIEFRGPQSYIVCE